VADRPDDLTYVEFMVEPFVEGHPGPHVTEAVAAAEAAGAVVDLGPFGSSCTVATSQVPALVQAITSAALGHGATHVSVHVARGEGSRP
jgi:uncharacterized protein YqgV (UPF0045/DUF77 family)